MRVETNMYTKFEVASDWSFVDTAGTSLVGCINAGYYSLEKAFGKPTELVRWRSGDGKVRCEWIIEFFDELTNTVTMATIYDWKETTTPVDYVRDWHIGGYTRSALDCVTEALTISIPTGHW